MLYDDYRNKFGIGQSIMQPPPAVPPVKNYIRSSRQLPQGGFPAIPQAQPVKRTGFSTGVPGAMTRPAVPAPQAALAPPPAPKQAQPIPTPALPPVSPSTAAPAPVRTAIPTSFPVDPEGSNKVSQERIQDYATREGGGYLSAGKSHFGTIDPSGSVITNGLGNGAASGINSNVASYDERADFQKNFGSSLPAPPAALPAPKRMDIENHERRQGALTLASEQKQFDDKVDHEFTGAMQAHQGQTAADAANYGHQTSALGHVAGAQINADASRYQSALQAPMWAGQGEQARAQAAGVPQEIALRADEVKARREDTQSNRAIATENRQDNKELAGQTAQDKAINDYAVKAGIPYGQAMQEFLDAKEGRAGKKRFQKEKPAVTAWYGREKEPARDAGWY